MKKWLAFALLLFVLAAPLGSLAATEKGGYTLTPMQELGGGVAPDSAFLLTTETAADQTDIQSRLSIDGEAAPHVTKKDANTFLVQPAESLESGRTLYLPSDTAGRRRPHLGVSNHVHLCRHQCFPG